MEYTATHTCLDVYSPTPASIPHGCVVCSMIAAPRRAGVDADAGLLRAILIADLDATVSCGFAEASPRRDRRGRANIARGGGAQQKTLDVLGGGSDPPSCKSHLLGGGSDPPSCKSHLLVGGGGLTPPPPAANTPVPLARAYVSRAKRRVRWSNDRFITCQRMATWSGTPDQRGHGAPGSRFTVHALAHGHGPGDVCGRNS